jgi:hypothetical protein
MSGTFGITTIQQFLQNILIAFSNINATLKTLAIGASGNNNFTGNNTFTGPTSFKPPPIINAGAAGTGTLLPEGLLSNQLNATGIGNGANTTDDMLFSYTLPANSLDAVGRAVVIEAHGGFAANGNNKTIKLFWNAFPYFSSGVLTDNGTAWYLRICLNKYFPGDQLGYAVLLHGGLIETVVVFGSIPDTSNITIQLTGASPTTGAANDVVAYRMAVEFLN